MEPVAILTPPVHKLALADVRAYEAIQVIAWLIRG